VNIRHGMIPLLLAIVPVLSASGPVKLEVIAEQDVLRAGEQLTVEVRLLSAANQPVAAPRPFHVLLQARLPSGKVENLRAVDFAAGEFTKKFALAIPGSGLVYLWAKHAELLPGGAFVRVKAAPAQGLAPAPAQPGSHPVMAEAPMTLPALELALRYSPDRPFLADGNDAVTVQAFLVGDADAAPRDIRLNVFDSSGTLHPTPLTIPRGEASGRAVLTSTHPGTVTVEYLGSAPAAQLEGDKKLQIRFRPAITRLDLRASPPGISLLDTSDLVVTLTDNQGRPLATDSPRAVSLMIDAGRGVIESQQVQIPAGGFQARSRFLPGISGQVTVSASTPNLLTATIPIQVSLPLALLLLSAAGGAVGGYLSYVKRKRSGIRQIWIGLITGFVFYWACIFLGLASVSRGVALNPVSALVLSIAGGWLQTSVLGMLTSRLKPRAKAG
jgi:hypothetical protein